MKERQGKLFADIVIYFANREVKVQRKPLPVVLFQVFDVALVFVCFNFLENGNVSRTSRSFDGCCLLLV